MLTHWNEIDRTFSTLDLLRRMEEAFGWEAPGAAPTPRAAALNVYDTGAALVLEAELPGYADNDVELTYEKGVLQLKGAQKVEPPQGYTVLRQERASTRFARSFKLPPEVDAERITASLEHGVLTITMPKRAETQPRTITVKKV